MSLRKFVVALDIDDSVPDPDISEYIEEAVASWGGQRHPDDELFTGNWDTDSVEALGLSDAEVNIGAMDNWQPNKQDIGSLCNSVTEDYIEEDRNSSDYCKHCGTHWGNAQVFYLDKGKKLPHESYCPVLVAQDIMTGFTRG